VAVHWYIDDFVPINLLDFTHDLDHDKFIFGTEACNGDRPWEAKVALGDWGRGEKYAHDIIGVSILGYFHATESELECSC
jgi:glucosylceramidase